MKNTKDSILSDKTLTKTEYNEIIRINQIQKMISRGITRWDIANTLADEWNIKPERVAYYYYPKAKDELLNDEDLKENLREKLLSMYLDTYEESRSQFDRKNALGALNSIVKLTALDQIKDSGNGDITIVFD